MDDNRAKTEWLILVVDDDPGLNRLIQKILKNAGFWTEGVSTGAECLEYLRKNRKTILLMDYVLPDFRGDALLEKIRIQNPGTPFLIITGFGDEKLAVNFMKLGARDYLIKDRNFLDLLPDILDKTIHNINTEQRLKEKEQEFEMFLNSSTEHYLLFDKDLKVAMINANARRFFFHDCPEDKLRGCRLNEFLGKFEIQLDENAFFGVVTDGHPLNLPDLVFTRDSRCRHMGLRAFKVGEGLGLILFDRTEKWMADEEIKRALEEKENLLLEVHHRVKNNLAIVSSLLSMQARRIDNPDLRGVLEDSLRRINSMALIHKEIYEQRIFSSIDFSEYAESLVRLLFENYNIYSDRVSLSLDLGRQAEIDLKSAVPLGMILSELISNSVKYAFPGDRVGRITLSLGSDDAGKISRMTYSDDGIGMESAAIESGKGLGLRLISDLAGQLGFEVEFVTGPGRGFSVTFTRFEGNRTWEEKETTAGKKGGPKLMIVEDEVIIARNLKYRLEEAGFDVCALAVSGEAAVTKLKEMAEVPDVVIMDVQLPGKMDGFATAEALNEVRPLPVIFRTAYENSTIESRLGDLSLDKIRMVEKDENLQELVRTINVLLER
jgi:two-component sensor histidine kinase/DNA-binding response OmpR family regulator